MKKLTLSLLIATVLNVANVFGQGGTTGPLTWNLSGGTLTISGNGAMPDYGYGEAPWYEYRESINSVIMETGVTTIGNNAFLYCTSLASVSIPNSVTTIGWNAFHSCGGLTSIIIPNSVTSIGDNAFAYCSSLISINIPNSITDIGQSAFQSCTSMTSIDVANENTTYASDNGVLFNKNKTILICCPGGKAGTYTIPNNVITIGHGAFWNCPSLLSIAIPNSVITIENSAFGYCSSLTSITIPCNVTTIEIHAFRGCTNLISIDVASENNTYASENGVLFNKNKTALICCPAGKTGNYVIPNNVRTIEKDAFNECRNLISIIISNNVTSILDHAFSYLTKLNSITIPCSVTSIENNNFAHCPILTFVTNLNPVPVAITPNVFYNANQSACTLIVPTTAVSAYKNADVWKEFNNIVGGGFLVNPISGNIEQGYTTGDGLYEINTNATVTAVPYIGYKFVNWTKNGTEVSKNNPYSFTVTEDVKLVANFEEGAETYSVIVSVNNESYGTATGGGTYEENEPATVTATANSGYKFVNWTKNGAEVSTANPYTFTVTEDVELVANFAEGVGIETITNDELQITVYPNPTDGVLHVETQCIASLQDVEMQVFDIMGRPVGTNLRVCPINNTETTIDISYLPSGIYFLKIAEKTVKFVRE